MPGVENVLPKEEQFDVVLARSFKNVANMFRNLSEESEIDDILDPSLELGYISDKPKFVEFCKALGGMLKREGEILPYLQELTYRSVIFAYQVISEIEDETPKHVSAEYLKDRASGRAAIAEAIREDVEAYLSTRPAMGEIITLFAPSLDPTRAYFEHVKIVAGFIFMLSEQQQAEKHLQEQAENFDPTTLLEGDE